MITSRQVGGTAHHDRSATWVNVLRRWAHRRPHQRICTFLIDGDRQESRLTYVELDRQARAIAARLQQGGTAVGERGLLLHPPGLDYVTAFMGCLYAGLIAVPMYPPHPARMELTLPRLRSIVADVRPRFVLTMTAGLRLAEVLGRAAPELRSPTWLATDGLHAGLAETWRDPNVVASTVALIQHTSGSTATPKGVVLTHANLLHNTAALYDMLRPSVDSLGVIWLPPYHDMGLVGGILQPLYAGLPVVLMSALHFLQRPLRWLTTLSRYRGTITAAPNFAYELCVRRTTAEERAALDLRSLEVAIVGAEPINPETLDRFAQAFAPSGFRPSAFRPCYGLAEATLLVTSSAGWVDVIPPPGRLPTVIRDATPVEDVSARAPVGCGGPPPGHRVVIVYPESRLPCPAGVTGEVWVAGPSVGQGYWKRPDETEATFRAYLAGSGDGPFLRTGDLGFVRDGELFITGRIKDLIIIRGRNYHPEDIEWTVSRSDPSLPPGSGAAFSVVVDGVERLVIVQEVGRRDGQRDWNLIGDAIRRAVVDEHDVPVAHVLLVRPRSIPRTSSGKIQRSACREAYLAGTLDRQPLDLRPTPVSEPI